MSSVKIDSDVLPMVNGAADGIADTANPDKADEDNLMAEYGSQAALVADGLRAIAHAPSRQPRTTLEPGTPWGPGGRYIIDRRLGRGGMGTVYAATDAPLKRIVALKVLDAAGPGGDADRHARLLREAQLAARMEHERIARIYDVGTHDGFAFVAMEYVPGGTLRDWMRDRELPVPQILDIATQIAEGLAELHAKHVIHRDLKPENVMLTEHGGIKLLDFGLARNAVAGIDEISGHVWSCGSESVSISVATAGTPGYMAPEQCAGQPLDERVDVFSLGVVIHELVTGKRLFQGANAVAIMIATLDGAPMLRDPAWLRVPERLRDHTAKMLASDPRARFDNGSRVLAALRELTGEMLRYRSLLPPAVSQTIGHSVAQRALAWVQSDHGRAPVRRRHVLIALATTACALFVYAWTRHVPHAPSAALADAARSSVRPGSRRPALPPSGMALIDVGTVRLGHDLDELLDECGVLPICNLEKMKREVPSVEVMVPPFYLDRNEVTNESFARFLDLQTSTLLVVEDGNDHYPRFVKSTRGSERELLFDLYAGFPVSENLRNSGIEYTSQRRFRVRRDFERLPTINVSWYGASLFCESQGKRLPTEDEWEAAARGKEGRRYPWGNGDPSCNDVVIKNDGSVWMSGVCSVGLSDHPRLRDVGTSVQDVTPQGVHDLGGNVSEWTASPYSDGNGAASLTAPAGEPRVYRGGSWEHSWMVRIAGRNYAVPHTIATNIGFRCALSVNAQPKREDEKTAKEP
jgi:formylglycine-generating enzyme required for sulfatase activity